MSDQIPVLVSGRWDWLELPDEIASAPDSRRHCASQGDETPVGKGITLGTKDHG